MVVDQATKSGKPLVVIHDDKIDEFIADLEAKVQTSGIAYDKWSDWHLDNPEQYSVE